MFRSGPFLMAMLVLVLISLAACFVVAEKDGPPPLAEWLETDPGAGRTTGHFGGQRQSGGSDETEGRPPHLKKRDNDGAKLFAEMAPRQKVLGLMHAIGLLRTKISLLEQMARAFEPSAFPNSKETHAGVVQVPPGPTLAYVDCRLGILTFGVCRHLGFLRNDPMLAPSSLQSKMLKLEAASALVAGLKMGTLNIHDDPDLIAITGPEEDLLRLASSALSSSWNAQLLYPAFDTRPVTRGHMEAAKNDTEAFLYASALRAKDLLRAAPEDDPSQFSAEGLAWIYAQLPSRTPPVPFTFYKDFLIPTIDGGQNGRSLQVFAQDNNSSSHPSPSSSPSGQQGKEIQRTEGGFLADLIGSFLPATLSPNMDSTGAALLTDGAKTANPVTILTSSVGGVASAVANTAQNAITAVTGEVSVNNNEEAAALEKTEKRLADILDMLPDEAEHF